MNPQKDNLYIEQQDKESNLYLQLQEKTLSELQRLSGKVWTDFNLHDPGVTITDILNYALTELDYRLAFPLQDYLTTSNKPFDPKAYGFYLPFEVFPVSPVTAKDYREYMLSLLLEIDNIRFLPSPQDGASYKYMVYAEKALFNPTAEEAYIISRIKECYHKKRNLCEELEDVRFIERKPLSVHGGIHIAAGMDHTQVLAEFLWEILVYLADYPDYYGPEEMELRDISPDRWMDGPLKNGSNIEFPFRDNTTETKLYHHLLSLNGIIAIHSFHLEDEEGKIINNFDEFYTITIPDSWEEIDLKVWVGNTEVTIDMAQVTAYIRTYYFRYQGKRIQQDGRIAFSFVPESTYRPVYEHEPVRNDFPNVYGINRLGLSSLESDRRKAQAKQLKAYLSLFDLTFVRGLSELQDLRCWMQQKPDMPQGQLFTPPYSSYLHDILTELSDIKEVETWNKRVPLKQKEQLLDLWDKLYGEDSNPVALRDFYYYDENPEDALTRRIEFLQKVPSWGENRFCACNVHAEISSENVPGIKKYFCTILGWERDEKKFVSTLLALYKLTWMTDREYFDDNLGNLTVLDPQILKTPGQEYVPLQPCTTDIDAYYSKILKHLPVLYKVLFESLFHGGIKLENYRIIPEGDSYLLAFKCKDNTTWVDLGRFFNKEKLIEVANRLRHFLVQLNKRSETMYIVEHIYFTPPEPFELTVVLSGWTARTSIPRFREICEDLLLNRLPAHIKIHFRWLDLMEMKAFENTWMSWRTSYRTGKTEEAQLYMNRIKEILQR